MAIVMISSMFQGGREELAQTLARKTNWPVLSREELLDQARDVGIKVGRLEMAMIKRPGISEKLAREKELYLAFLTATLSEKALQGDLIYHGRAGHLLLPGVSHRLRVGLTAPWDVRVKRASMALRMTQDKADLYLSQLDEDVAKWIRYVHGADGNDPNHFDVFLNLENMGISNAAGILCATAELPDFQPTPASMKLLNDLHLASQARVRLATDERTQEAECQVLADEGVITVMYPPHQAKLSKDIPKALADLEGCREIQCTMAESNILWVQERFEPESENFRQIITLAQRWGAAVELLRLLPGGMAIDSEEYGAGSEGGFGRQECFAPDGGVEDDDPTAEVDDGGLGKTQEALVGLGRSGGRHTVCGGYEKILETAQGAAHYNLVVIGDMFLSKGHSTRTRQTRELAMTIRDRLKAPVITTDELKSRFLFGKKQAAFLLGFLALIVLVYVLVFTNQKGLLNFLNGPLHDHYKWLAAVAVGAFSPFIAWIYGTVTGLAFKMINID